MNKHKPMNCCPEAHTAIKEGAIRRESFTKGNRHMTVFSIGKPRTDPDDWLAIQYCPFCGKTVPDLETLQAIRAMAAQKAKEAN